MNIRDLLMAMLIVEDAQEAETVAYEITSSLLKNGMRCGQIAATVEALVINHRRPGTWLPVRPETWYKGIDQAVASHYRLLPVLE